MRKRLVDAAWRQAVRLDTLLRVRAINDEMRLKLRLRWSDEDCAMVDFRGIVVAPIGKRWVWGQGPAGCQSFQVAVYPPSPFGAKLHRLRLLLELSLGQAAHVVGLEVVMFSALEEGRRILPTQNLWGLLYTRVLTARIAPLTSTQAAAVRLLCKPEPLTWWADRLIRELESESPAWWVVLAMQHGWI